MSKNRRKGQHVEEWLTPTQHVVPHEVLLLGEHGHHDKRVQVDPLTQHPEVVASEEVQMDEHRHFTARLGRKDKNGLLSIGQMSAGSGLQRRVAVLATNLSISTHFRFDYDSWWPQAPETHRVSLHQLLVVGYRCQPNDGDDGVQNKWEEEVFVQSDPLAAQAPTRKAETPR